MNKYNCKGKQSLVVIARAKGLTSQVHAHMCKKFYTLMGCRGGTKGGHIWLKEDRGKGQV